jgi:hypothetical protein
LKAQHVKTLTIVALSSLPGVAMVSIGTALLDSLRFR